MTLLTHADVARRFLPSAILKREDLDPGIIACLEARDACHGIKIIGAKIAKERKGSFWADFSISSAGQRRPAGVSMPWS